MFSSDTGEKVGGGGSSGVKRLETPGIRSLSILFPPIRELSRALPVSLLWAPSQVQSSFLVLHPHFRVPVAFLQQQNLLLTVSLGSIILLSINMPILDLAKLTQNFSLSDLSLSWDPVTVSSCLSPP